VARCRGGGWGGSDMARWSNLAIAKSLDIAARGRSGVTTDKGYDETAREIWQVMPIDGINNGHP